MDGGDAAITKHRFRAYCFTLNNYSELERITLLHTDCAYIVIGKEVGLLGTPHLQGYIAFKDKKSLAQMRKLCPRSHWEGAKGSAAANFAYCSKEGDFEERGIRPLTPEEKGAAEKARWKGVWDLAKAGLIEEIPEDVRLRYYRTIKEIRKDYMVKPPDAEDTTGVWIYGPAGIGKSRKAREDYPDAYLKMANKWWCGYQNESNVIIDDLDPKHECLGHHLKIWADRYSFLAEIKGGAVHIRPQKIVVTSQYHPTAIWTDKETQDAILRRFIVIELVTLSN